MTDFILAMEARVKADQAKAALAGVKTDIAAVGTAAKEASVDSAKIGPAIAQAGAIAKPAVVALDAELGNLHAELLNISAAAPTAGQQTAALANQMTRLETSVGRGGGGAAGSVGNLVSQFNDIGMMMAAGQNPLQLAIQQGSQITQVIGPMGASGAVKALGGALLGMLNPVNLVTYAVIATAAAFVQWLTSSEEGAKSLDAAIGDLETSVKTLADIGGQSLKSVKEDFGDITPEVAKLSEALGKLADTQAVIALKDAFRALKGEVEGDWLSSDNAQVADLLKLRLQTPAGDGMTIESNPAIEKFQASLAQLQDTSGVADQLAVIQSINQQFIAATGGIGNMTVAQSEYYSKILATESALRRIVVAQQDAARAQLEIRRAANVENDRMGGPTQYDKPVDVGLEQRVAARKEAEAARKEAAALLEELAQQAEMLLLIGQYGANSAEVARARAAAEREAFVELTNARQISQEMKDELIAAYDATAELAALDFASGLEKALFVAEALGKTLGISLADAQAALASMVASAPGGGWLSGAIGDASTLAGQLWEAARAAAAARGGAVVNANPSKGPGFEGGGRSGSTAAPYVAPAPTLDEVITKYASKGGKGGGGGGGGGGKVDPDSFKALTDAAEKAMATLEAAVASIHEKVALGLMTTAEGTKAIASAKEQAATSIAELIPKLEKANDVAGPKAAAAVGKWRAEVKGLVVDLGIAGSELSEKLSSNFEKGFASFLSGAKGGKAAMADFKNFILQQLAEIAAQKFTSNIISPLLDSLVGGIFGGGAGGSGGTGSMGLPNPFKFANGGIPGGPGIAAYSGSIVDRPTFFPMAKGAFGLMGEAGPEAVVPLARGADGKLGIRNSGGGGPVTVNVINNAQGTKTTQQQRTEGGMSIIDVVIEQVEATMAGNLTQGRGPMSDAMSTTFGLSRIGN